MDTFSCGVLGTWHPLNTWFRWSFEALTKGFHPSEDPWGGPLPKGSELEALAGLPLTKGDYQGFLWCLQGDQEFLSNILKLPHWASVSPCHFCDAKKPIIKKKPCKKGKSFKILLEEKQRYRYVSTEEAVLNPRSNHPFFSIEGVSTNHIRGDALHIFWCRGIAAHLCGSLIHFICFFDGTGRQLVPASQRLSMLFSHIVDIYKRDKTPVRLNNLRLSMVCEPKSPHSSFAVLDAKAAEMKYLGPPLLEVVQALLDSEDEVQGAMVQCLHAWCSIIQVFDGAGVFLTAEEYSLVEDLGKRFFTTYDFLSKWALSKGRKLFHVTFKFHSGHHLLRDSKYVNPRVHWNFRGEDFVSKISQLGHSCCFGLKSSKLSYKLSLKYRVLLQLQLTRPGFSFKENAETAAP